MWGPTLSPVTFPFVRRRKHGRACNAQQTGGFGTTIRGLELRGFDLSQRRAQPAIEGEARISGAQAARRAPNKLDANVMLQCGQRSANRLQRTSEMMGCCCEASFFDDRNEGLIILDPVQPAFSRSTEDCITFAAYSHGFIRSLPVLHVMMG